MQREAWKWGQGMCFDIQGWHRSSNIDKPNREELIETQDWEKRSLAAAFEIWNQWNVEMAVTTLCPVIHPCIQRQEQIHQEHPWYVCPPVKELLTSSVPFITWNLSSESNLNVHRAFSFHFLVQWICLHPVYCRKGFLMDTWVRKMPNKAQSILNACVQLGFVQIHWNFRLCHHLKPGKYNTFGESEVKAVS